MLCVCLMMDDILIRIVFPDDNEVSKHISLRAEQTQSLMSFISFMMEKTAIRTKGQDGHEKSLYRFLFFGGGEIGGKDKLA